MCTHIHTKSLPHSQALHCFYHPDVYTNRTKRKVKQGRLGNEADQTIAPHSQATPGFILQSCMWRINLHSLVPMQTPSSHRKCAWAGHETIQSPQRVIWE